MKTDQAHDTLITIRTLMERSSIYRRTLAPIMIFVGTLGIVGAVLGIWLDVCQSALFPLTVRATVPGPLPPAVAGTARGNGTRSGGR